MPTDGPPDAGFRHQPLWLLAVAGLAFGQAGLALQLFGSRNALADGRPVVAGRHPLHLYHAGLGADAFRHRRTTACYDPAFQAGYPKTPVFDGGCRPAEFALYLAGDGNDAAAYKLGLFAGCLLVPLAFAAAGRGAGLCPAGCVLAGALGCGVWWSPPVRSLLDAGNADLLLAGLAAVVFVPWLSRYNWEPGLTAWLVLAATAVVGWYAHPVVWLGLGPAVGVYYLAVAPRHGPAWHLGLAGVTLAGLAPNLWWLWDWGKYWWLRQPSVDDLAPLPTWGAVLDSWRGNAELLGPAPLGWPLVVLGLVGCGRLLRDGHRTAPALLAGVGLFAFLVARLGQVWPPFVNGGADRAAPFAAALAVLPAAGLLTERETRRHGGWPAAAVAVALLAAVGWGGDLTAGPRHRLNLRTDPLPLGLTADQEEFVRGLVERTTPEARILLEEANPLAPGWNWTALLPDLTGRAFLGGLDPDACFEHAFCSLRGDRLNGRRLHEWSDVELAEFCRRYNVGWVACHTPAAADRWRRLPRAKEVARFRENGRVLFELDRPRSFVLVGSATWAQADRRKVVLTDVVPADFPAAGDGPGKVVVLSLHHQAGLRVSPNVVRIDRDPDPFDPIPLLRLRMNGPVSRVVLSWENP